MAEQGRGGGPNRALAALGVAALVGGGGWIYWTGTLECSLQRLAGAVQDRNRYLFEKHVDLEHMTRLLVDDFLAVQIQELKQQPLGPWEQLGAGLGITFVELIKPRLMDEMRYVVTRGVESGALERGDLKAERRVAEQQDQLGVALEEMADDFPKVKPMTLGKIERKGGTATVVLSLQLVDDLPGEPPAQELRVRFVRTPDRYWRATELENFKDILRLWHERQAKRLELANAPVRAMIGETVAVLAVGKEQGINSLGLAKDAWIVATMKNLASAGIQGVEADVTISDAGGELKKVRIQDVESIPPGETRQKAWSLGLDLSDAIDRLIYDTDPARLLIKVDVRHLVLSDGRAIKLAESLEEVEVKRKSSERRPPAPLPAPPPKPLEAL